MRALSLTTTATPTTFTVLVLLLHYCCNTKCSIDPLIRQHYNREIRKYLGNSTT